jgi:hypothetical protein
MEIDHYGERIQFGGVPIFPVLLHDKRNGPKRLVLRPVSFDKFGMASTT